MADINVDLIRKIDISVKPYSLNIGTIDVSTVSNKIESKTIDIKTQPSRISMSIIPLSEDSSGKIDVVISKSNLKGDKGEGVPTGGTENQILAKKSSTNYDTYWIDNTGGYNPPAPEDGSIIRDANGLISSIVLETNIVSIIRDVNGLISGIDNLVGGDYIFNRTNGRISSWEVV